MFGSLFSINKKHPDKRSKNQRRKWKINSKREYLIANIPMLTCSVVSDSGL